MKIIKGDIFINLFFKKSSKEIHGTDWLPLLKCLHFIQTCKQKAN